MALQISPNPHENACETTNDTQDNNMQYLCRCINYVDIYYVHVLPMSNYEYVLSMYMY